MVNINRNFTYLFSSKTKKTATDFINTDNTSRLPSSLMIVQTLTEQMENKILIKIL